MTLENKELTDKMSKLNPHQSKIINELIDIFIEDTNENEQERIELFEAFKENFNDILVHLLKTYELIGFHEAFDNSLKNDKNHFKLIQGKHIEAIIEICKALESMIHLFEYRRPKNKELNLVKRGFEFKSGSYIVAIHPYTKQPHTNQ